MIAIKLPETAVADDGLERPEPDVSWQRIQEDLENYDRAGMEPDSEYIEHLTHCYDLNSFVRY